jgi:phosphoribosylformimino-5-aminoimidazole carboxamide ribonucleotide (ProFAR) isomerase
VNHAGVPDVIAEVAAAGSTTGLEVLAAGGVRDLDGLRRLRELGVTGIILGEALLSGAIDYVAAREAAA